MASNDLMNGYPKSTKKESIKDSIQSLICINATSSLRLRAAGTEKSIYFY
jgi:hypothetical protein